MRNRTRRIGAAAALLVLATSLSATAAPVLGPCPRTSGGVYVVPWSDDLGTGEDGGTPHAIGATDPDWRIVPGNGPTYSVTPVSSWVTTPNANWINSSASSYSSPGASTTTPTQTRFRTQFTLPPNNFLRSITLNYAADNGVLFYLNNVLIGGFDPPLLSTGLPDPTAFTGMHTLVWTGAGFNDGLNSLDAVVTDYGVRTGLLVSGTANACQPGVSLTGVCVEVSKDHTELVTYSPAPYDLGTGETGYTPHAPGTPDDQWTTVAPVAGPAFSVATYPGWVGSTTSTWINRVASATGALYGSRTYRVTFPVGSGAYYRDLDIWYAADNGVLFYLNGTPIGGYDPPTSVADAFNQTRHLVWAGAGFVTGTNVLTAVVTDEGTATGLLVEGGSHACYDKTIGQVEDTVKQAIG